jgi:Fic-DOC domain mobile mystery protein B
MMMIVVVPAGAATEMADEHPLESRPDLAGDEKPDSATDLDPDEAEGLIPDLVTRGELNAWEHSNILKAEYWLLSRRRRLDVLSIRFVLTLHRRMFDDTWTWAGTFRKTGKNIGVPPHQIAASLRDLLNDVDYWLEHGTYPLDQIAARFHHRMVAIHPFPNGNGRHGRLIADLLLRSRGAEPFTWGHGNLQAHGDARERYLKALKAADGGEIGSLIEFARS